MTMILELKLKRGPPSVCFPRAQLIFNLGLSPKTEIAFPHEPHILFFYQASAFIDWCQPALVALFGIPTLPPAGRKKVDF